MTPARKLYLPWREAGWNARQAAAHLLDRFAHGARPGDVGRLVEGGLAAWVERQIEGGLPDPRLASKIAALDSLRLDNLEIVETFPGPGKVLREALREGVIGKDSELLREADEKRSRDARQDRLAVLAFARKKGYRPVRDLLGQLVAQKIHRAVLSESQLHEVLSDFWLNHFNVSIGDECRVFVATYERDPLAAALRAYVPRLLPERDPAPTVERLEPLVQDPELARKLAERTPPADARTLPDDWDELEEAPAKSPPPSRGVDAGRLAQVVGVILGSPEFQRR